MSAIDIVVIMSANSKQLIELSTSIRELFHLLTLAGETIHSELPVSIPQRAILESLFKNGRQTIPEIAQNRSVSRQFIQKNVDYLSKNNFVLIQDNPGHKRSFYLVLTQEGKELISSMLSEELKLFDTMGQAYTKEELENTLTTLNNVKGQLQKIRNFSEEEDEPIFGP